MPHFAIGCVEFVPLKIGTPYRIIWSQTGTQGQDCCPELPFEKHVRTSSTNSPLMLASFFFLQPAMHRTLLTSNVLRSLFFLWVSLCLYVVFFSYFSVSSESLGLCVLFTVSFYFHFVSFVSLAIFNPMDFLSFSIQFSELFACFLT